MKRLLVERCWLLWFVAFLSIAGCGGQNEAAKSLDATSDAPPSTNLEAFAGNGQVTPHWEPVEGATSYNLYYLTYPGVTASNSKQIADASSGEPITGLTNETTYYFVVTVVKDSGESEVSNEVEATPMPPVVGVPDNLSVSGGLAEATLQWRWVPDATSYNIYYGTEPGITTNGPNKIEGVHLTQYNFTDLLDLPARYYFIVTAVNSSGEGQPSKEIVATAKPAYTQVAAGYGHSVALRVMHDDFSYGIGEVYSWGDNGSGQLGTEQSGNKTTTAVKASGINSVVAIGAGWHHSLGLRTDGSVWNWGLNDYGQLGNLGTTNSDVAVQASGLDSVLEVASSEKHSLALKDDGTVWSWGFNQQGQLGYSSINCQVPFPLDQTPAWSCSFTPTEVSGITGSVRKIGAGFYHSFAITDGAVWAWGQNDSGQLGDIPPNCPAQLQVAGDLGAHGDQAYTCSTTPVQVAGINGEAIAATGGWGHSLVLLDDGTVWAWGKNDYGQLGFDQTADSEDIDNLTCVQTSAFTFPCRIKPIQVEGLSNIVAIAAGWDHNIALKNDGTVWTWGRNDEGQLGNGEFSQSANPTPQMLPDLSGVISIAAGAYHSVVLKEDATAWAWGYNGHGQLGNGSLASSSTPVQVHGLVDPVIIVPGL